MGNHRFRAGSVVIQEEEEEDERGMDYDDDDDDEDGDDHDDDDDDDDDGADDENHGEDDDDGADDDNDDDDVPGASWGKLGGLSAIFWGCPVAFSGRLGCYLAPMGSLGPSWSFVGGCVSRIRCIGPRKN